ncbi:MAG: phosphatidate cytidylyltransferase [Actinomycetota bacterium]
MLKDRVTSALIGVPLILLFMFLGKYSFAVLVAVIAVVCLDEFYSMLMMRNHEPNVIVGVLGSLSVIAGALVGSAAGAILGLVLTTVIAFIWQTFTRGGIAHTGLTIAGVVYIALTLSHLTMLYNLSFGLAGVLLVFIGTWLSDISAYAFGLTIGKRKLAPVISAKKTVEGSIAGFLVPAIVLGLIFLLPQLPFAVKDGFAIALAKGLVMGAIIGFVAPIGDLVESAIKRELRVKDSGVIIRGHGGFLDRFDSIIFTAVFGYYYWLLIV